MKNFYKACVIGVGRIGFTLGFDKKREQPASHTMALLDNPNIKIVAGADTDFEKLKQWKAFVDSKQSFFCHNSKNSVQIFCAQNQIQPELNSKKNSILNDFKVEEKINLNFIDEIFEKCAPDIVVISVNEESHLSVALKVISKKPRLIILEKPVALNSQEGEKIVAQSKKFDVPILVNHERRFAKDYKIARDYLPQIGEVQKINANLFSGMRLYDSSKEATGGYSLLHDGTHLVDIVLYFLEALTNENLANPILTGLTLDKNEKNVVRAVTVNYSTKCAPDIALTFSGKSRFFGFELEVIGTEGRIKIGNGFAEFFKRAESKLYSGFYSLQKDNSIKIPLKTGYFSEMVKNAVEFLDGKSELRSTLQTGMNALKVLEEIKSKLINSL